MSAVGEDALLRQLRGMSRGQYEEMMRIRLERGSHSGAGGGLTLAQTAITGRGSASIAAALSTYKQHFEEMALLGRGGFGQVVLTKHRLDGKLQAVKRLHFNSLVPPWEATTHDERLRHSRSYSTSARLLREVESLSSMSHPRIVRYRTCWIEPRWNRLVSDSGSNTGPGTANGGGTDEMGSPVPSMDPMHKQARLSNSPSILDVDGSDRWDSVDPVDEEEASEGTSELDGSGDGPTEIIQSPRRVGTRDDSRDEGDINLGVANTAKKLWPYTLYVAMDVCRGVTLEKFMEPGSNNDIDERLGSEILLQLAEGLDYVHNDAQLIHRDIKPANLFVDVVPSSSGISSSSPPPPQSSPFTSAGHGIPPPAVPHTAAGQCVHLTICDFGLATWNLPHVSSEECVFDESVCSGSPPDDSDFDSSPRCTLYGRTSHASSRYSNHQYSDHSSGVGTLSYCAPEQLTNVTYNEKVDIFSMGIICVELFTKFDTRMERAEVLADARRGVLPQAMRRSYPFHAELASRMLSEDPSMRPSARDLVRELRERFDELWASSGNESTSPMKRSMSWVMNVLKDQKDRIQELEAALKKEREENEALKFGNGAGEKERVDAAQHA